MIAEEMRRASEALALVLPLELDPLPETQDPAALITAQTW